MPRAASAAPRGGRTSAVGRRQGKPTTGALGVPVGGREHRARDRSEPGMAGLPVLETGPAGRSGGSLVAHVPAVRAAPAATRPVGALHAPAVRSHARPGPVALSAAGWRALRGAGRRGVPRGRVVRGRCGAGRPVPVRGTARWRCALVPGPADVDGLRTVRLRRLEAGAAGMVGGASTLSRGGPPRGSRIFPARIARWGLRRTRQRRGCGWRRAPTAPPGDGMRGIRLVRALPHAAAA